MLVFPSLPKIPLCIPQAQQLNTCGTVAPTKADYNLFLEEGAHRRLTLGFLKPSPNTSADQACRSTFPALSFESGVRRLRASQTTSPGHFALRISLLCIWWHERNILGNKVG